MWRHFTQESSASKNPERLIKDYSNLFDQFTMPENQKQTKSQKPFKRILNERNDSRHKTQNHSNFQIGLRL